MELKLSSGRVVEINRPSVRDAIRCHDIVVPQFEVIGQKVKKVSMPLNNMALAEWAACGLGVDIDDLFEYSRLEREEIGGKVQEIADLNPTKEPS